VYLVHVFERVKKRWKLLNVLSNIPPLPTPSHDIHLDKKNNFNKMIKYQKKKGSEILLFVLVLFCLVKVV
jgi:hypothetical protein